MNLYKPEKYKVITGEKSNSALCICWANPDIVIQKHPNLTKDFLIIGTLYSKEGVSIILRNLALNPNIRYLFLWGNTPLSKTPFGLAGQNLLKTVWNTKTKDSDLHQEIDEETLQKIIGNVELIDISDLNLDQLSTATSQHELPNIDKYMEPQSFPDPVRDENAPMPSEKIGWTVRGQTIYTAWLKTVDRIIRYGHIKDTEYGTKIREIHNINWVIESEDVEKIFEPDIDEKVKELIGFSKESLEKYKASLLDPKVAEGTSYTYGSRLRNYPKNIDQVDKIIEKLNESIITRRAVSITYIPEIDSNNSSPPCLIYVQCLTDENNNLNMFATFRSHDIFKAGIPNSYGLLNLQEYICQNTNLKRGVLSINSVSAHIYEEDWKNAGDLLKCQIWERNNFKYDENNDTDPRGIVRIFTDKEDISLEIQNLKGEVIYSDTSKFGRDIILKLSKLNLLSSPDHYADITIELVKAELAIKSGQLYIQDKPFSIGNAVIA